jgi:N-acetylneuraminate synthase
MDVRDLQTFMENLAILADVLGQDHKAPLADEAPAREHARRSIVIDRPLTAGQVICEADLTYKRPAHGISPLFWDEVIGRISAHDLPEDHILQWPDLK